MHLTFTHPRLTLAALALTLGLMVLSTAMTGLVAEQPTAEEAEHLPISTVSAAVTEVPTSEESLDSDVLWLARAIYSESKLPDEQRLVAWVVRNRVETKYRGLEEYRDVILDPYQFSAFNSGSSKRALYLGLTPQVRQRGWQRALRIAADVLEADPSERPFPVTTRHFYSEQSMVGRLSPDWAHGEQPIELPRGYNIDPRRFRFYANVI